MWKMNTGNTEIFLILVKAEHTENQVIIVYSVL